MHINTTSWDCVRLHLFQMKRVDLSVYNICFLNLAKSSGHRDREPSGLDCTTVTAKENHHQPLWKSQLSDGKLVSLY